jgi:hypothetical protein
LEVDKAKISEMVAAFGHRLQVVGVDCSQVLHDSEKYLPELQAVAKSVFVNNIRNSIDQSQIDRTAIVFGGVKVRLMH